MKAVCHIKPAYSAESLINAFVILKHPSLIVQQQYGGANMKIVQRMHMRIKWLINTVLMNLEWAHLGASPDGAVKCACDTNGVMEI